MKRLFRLFQNETDLAWQCFIRMNGTYTPPPPPPPLKWYQKIWQLILAFFGYKKPEPVEPVIPTTISELSIAFHEWLEQRRRYQRFARGLRFFNDKFGKFEIRKWIEKEYGKITSPDSPVPADLFVAGLDPQS